MGPNYTSLDRHGHWPANGQRFLSPARKIALLWRSIISLPCIVDSEGVNTEKKSRTPSLFHRNFVRVAICVASACCVRKKMLTPLVFV